MESIIIFTIEKITTNVIQARNILYQWLLYARWYYVVINSQTSSLHMWILIYRVGHIILPDRNPQIPRNGCRLAHTFFGWNVHIHQGFNENFQLLEIFVAYKPLSKLVVLIFLKREAIFARFKKLWNWFLNQLKSKKTWF